MRLGLVVLLNLAVCAAQISWSNAYFPAPVFDEGENLSSHNCGNETARNQWIVDVQNTRNQRGCYNFKAISQKTILELGDCSFTKNDTADLRVFPRNCYMRETEEECIRLSAKVLDVMKIAVSSTSLYKFTMMITEEMPSVVTPICLFNRDNAMDWKPYYEFSPNSIIPPRQTNVMEQGHCSRLLHSTQLLRHLQYFKIPIQKILCVQESNKSYGFLINFYKGRYFLRGLKYKSDDRFYIDILPFIDVFARNAKDISVLRPMPEKKQPRGFTAPNNLSFRNCGRKRASTRRKRGNDDSSEEVPLNRYIFGGNISQTGHHPWHAYIENEVTGAACGGTLISPTVVLTAAHCIYGSEAEDFIVALGMYDKRQRRAPGVKRRKLSSLIVHPQYDPEESMSDVGLMILSKKVEISDNVRPICLWNDDSDSNLARVAGTKAMAVGFGLADNYTLPDELQEVRLPILAHKECYLSKKRFFGKYLLPGDNFCAGYTNGTTTCNGDSGGSLSIEKDGRWFIRGIVSSGMSKKVMFEGEERLLCHPNQYSLFADVAGYVDWIVENTPEISFRN